MKRPPPHHAGAGGIAKNVWGVSKASNTWNASATKHQQASARNVSVTTETSYASVARSLLLERHAVHVGLAQLEAGALVEGRDVRSTVRAPIF